MVKDLKKEGLVALGLLLYISPIFKLRLFVFFLQILINYTSCIFTGTHGLNHGS